MSVTSSTTSMPQSAGMRNGTDSDAGRDLQRKAQFHAVTFQVSDLERARAHVESRGVRTQGVDPGHVILNRSDCLGVGFRLTDRDISGW